MVEQVDTIIHAQDNYRRRWSNHIAEINKISWQLIGKSEHEELTATIDKLHSLINTASKSIRS